MAAFVTLVLAVQGWTVLTLPALAATLLIGHFFRDPVRVTNAGDADLVSPADGRIIAIDRMEADPLARRPCLRVSIFMSVFDVHVNRVPVSGVVQEVRYRKGTFLAANLPRASRENEQNWVRILSDGGQEVVMTQVAGLIARRIVCWPRAGDRVEQGERFGMIRFGSRMDVFVPVESEVLVSMGQHVYGGETVLCRLK
ncbi:MAG: phosphatidylserine decarboxylase family protein [Syntrophobacteraceae bacterium]|nr:phosphatidylserine decarboxylase family protein [Syntrophobacteraceae bacterium]